MILQAGYDCYLTQAEEVPVSERRFENQVLLKSPDEALEWKEITSKQRDEMVLINALLDVGNMSYATISKTEEVIRKVSEGLTENINSVSLTRKESIEKKDWYPTWETIKGVEVTAGFKFTYEGVLYEVLQRHTIKDEYVPGKDTEKLYKVVSLEPSGEKDDPIVWVHNMVLEEGKYYTDKDVLYLCLRGSKVGMALDLEYLVSDGYVKVDDGDKESKTEESFSVSDGYTTIPMDKGFKVETNKK